MFELAGIFSYKGNDLSAFESPFENIRDHIGIECQEKYVKNDFTSLYMLSSKRNPELIVDSNMLLLIYGRCYSKPGCKASEDAQKLTAKDVLHIYKEKGNNFTSHIKGSFAILIINQSTKSLEIFTDPLNILSFYYFSDGGDYFLFSSSLSVLSRIMRQAGNKVSINHTSVIEHYLFDFTIGEDTFLENIREVPPGSSLFVDRGKISVKQYFNPFKEFRLHTELLPENEASEMLKEMLRKNIELYNEGPENTAVALTGGYDSRSILALMDKDFKEYQYYSYGSSKSWDVKVPIRISREYDLNYKNIELGERFKDSFNKYADSSIILGDGKAEASRANYTYAYSNFFSDKKSIMTGLFGSELIKNPSSRGLFLDENILMILKSNSASATINQMLNDLISKKIFPKDYVEEQREVILQNMMGNKYIINDFPLKQKIFYFLLMVGVRKYFGKEVKVEKPFVENLAPWFDIELITMLLKTPFPWVYNWSETKNLLKNIKIHKLYSDLINNRSGLLRIISTHGYRPLFLRHSFLYPFLALEFYIMKKKISKNSGLNFESMCLDFINEYREKFDSVLPLNFDPVDMVKTDRKDYIKMYSLDYWLKSLNI